MIAMNKLSLQAATAAELKQQVDYRQSQFAIDKERNRRVQENLDADAKQYLREERQTWYNKRLKEKSVEQQVQAQMPQQKAIRLQEHLL